MAAQRRRLSITMTEDEIHAFLASERTCRVATAGPSGPHVVPLWFTWDRTALWCSSLVHSQRWADLLRDPRTAVVVDAGESYGELRGVELRGSVAIVGEVPREGRNVYELIEPEATFASKYALLAVPHDGRHAWLKLVPDRIISWDFRKLPLDGPIGL